MADPNFLHWGDHTHLGPGIWGTRKTNPAVDLHDFPKIDAVLISHYHAQGPLFYFILIFEFLVLHLLMNQYREEKPRGHSNMRQ